MQLKLTLHTSQKGALLPFNYQYPLSAAIYKIIQSADAGFAAFLHNKGYGNNGKRFKLFSFSDIRTPFVKSGDRMQLQTGIAEVIICFYMPQAAEHFIMGLFINQQLPIADRSSKTTFEVQGIESLALPPLKDNQPIALQPLSPLVVGRKNDKGHYVYRSPDDEDFTACLLHNWLEKFRAVYDADATAIEQLKQMTALEVQLLLHPPQQRLITIKGGTDAETKIRGYTKFRLAVAAPKELIKLALGAGLGLYNAQGMGCVGLV